MRSPDSHVDGRTIRVPSLATDPRLLTVLAISVCGTMGPNVASPALPAMTGALSVTDGQVGLVMTAYTLPAMVMVPLSSALADMYGRRTVVIPSLLLFGIAGVAIGFSADVAALVSLSPFRTVLGLRVLQGVGVAGFMSLTVAILGDLYSGSTGATAQGFRVGANGFGTIVVPVLAGALVALGWYAPFFLYGLALVAAAVAFRLLPETAVGVEEGTGVRETITTYVRSLRAELHDLQVGLLIFGGVARDLVRYAVITFLPLFAVRVLGASFAEAGALLALRGVAAIAVSPLSGRLTERFSGRFALVLALTLTGGSVALLPLSPSLLVLALAVVVYSVGDALYSPVLKNAVTDVTDEEHRSGVVGGMQMLKYAAQTASPAFFGIVLAIAGYGALFWIAASVSAVYALSLLGLLREPTRG